MIVGVFSDTHDNMTQLARALAVFADRGVDAVLHAGDVIAPFAAKAIAKVGVPLHIIYGNNDGERAGLKQILGNIVDGPIEIDLDGRRIAMAHDFSQIPDALRRRADVLVAGHTHQSLLEIRDDTLWLNSGECCGWFAGTSSVAVLDTGDLKAEIIQLPVG